MEELERAAERLAILTAFRKELEERITEARSEVDSLLEDSDPMDVRVCGRSVGTILHRFSKERRELRCDDFEAFLGWLSDDGIAYFERFMASKHGQKLLDECASALIVDGEVPAGCRVVEIPSIYLGFALNGCSPDDVDSAMRGSLQEAAVKMLGGAEDAE